MFTIENITGQASLKCIVWLLNIKFDGIPGLISPQLTIALKYVFFIWVFIFAGYLLTGGWEWVKSTLKSSRKLKPVGEIIKFECRQVECRDIRLDVFTNGIHCLANKIFLYARGEKSEYILVLNTDRGCLVETYFESVLAYDEFLFICLEDEAAKEGITVSINFFNSTLYDYALQKEINRKGSYIICETLAES